MDCLLEVYDREQINNILDVLAFSPKKAVFLYDPRTADAEDLRAVETACRLRLPRLEVEAVPADLGDLNAVYRACKGVVRRNEGCFVDITGGGELGAVGAYLACKETYSPIFIVDPPRGSLRSIAGCRELERSFRLPRFTMDVLLAAHGAAIAGYGHPKPDKSMHQALLSFCGRVFDDIPRWKDLCLYLQTGCASFPVEDDRGRFYAPQEIASSILTGTVPRAVTMPCDNPKAPAVVRNTR